MEVVYVDDMLVKSLEAKNHIFDLEEAFVVLRRSRMKLKPSKCAFGVTSGKFLCFMISQRGIEANQEKIKAILDMASQKESGRSKDLQEGSPPSANSCQMSPAGVSSVLVRHEGKTEHPIYYVSQVLHDAETMYQEIQKFAFAVVISARKKPDASDRLINWAIELGEFDIHVKPRLAMKSQVLADFVAGCTVPIEEYQGQDTLVEEPVQAPLTMRYSWMIYVDGSANSGRSGAGLVLTGLDNFLVEYALKLDFMASNNEAEYEALLAGIALVSELNADQLKAHNDSHLIVGHVNCLYEAKEPRMLRYLEKVRSVISVFSKFEIIQIPRTMNVRADALSKMASSGAIYLGNVYAKVLPRPSIDKEEVHQIEEEPSWMDPILRYLKNSELPQDRKEARQLLAKAAHYVLDRQILYKYSFA
ncbi:uncharacterized protein LOC143852463 [Tasmannia lanceolata]|uniref:uncharacterized protein LOC143852463 n=1 Tax=Tasmannia lanceolata TaxID=3420 RepID=UPI0040643530